jgi:serine/threonine protein phosphatase PrpC
MTPRCSLRTTRFIPKILDGARNFRAPSPYRRVLSHEDQTPCHIKVSGVHSGSNLSIIVFMTSAATVTVQKNDRVVSLTPPPHPSAIRGTTIDQIIAGGAETTVGGEVAPIAQGTVAIYCASNNGTRPVKENNQDSLAVVQVGDSLLIAVADGHGGHRFGEVASEAVVASLAKSHREGIPLNDSARFMQEALITAHRQKLVQLPDSPPSDDDAVDLFNPTQESKPGTTIAASIIDTVTGEQLFVHQGDTVGMIIRPGVGVVWRSWPHSLVQQCVDKGCALENVPVPIRGVVTNSVRCDRDPEIGPRFNQGNEFQNGQRIVVNTGPDGGPPEQKDGFKLLAGDRLLIMSDGGDSATLGRLAQLSDESASPIELAKKIVAVVRDHVDQGRGGADNFSLIIHQQGFIPSAAETVTAAPQDTWVAQLAPPPSPPKVSRLDEALAVEPPDAPIPAIFSATREWLERHIADPTIRDKDKPDREKNNGFRVEVGRENVANPIVQDAWQSVKFKVLDKLSRELTPAKSKVHYRMAFADALDDLNHIERTRTLNPIIAAVAEFLKSNPDSEAVEAFSRAILNKLKYLQPGVVRNTLGDLHKIMRTAFLVQPNNREECNAAVGQALRNLSEYSEREIGAQSWDALRASQRARLDRELKEAGMPLTNEVVAPPAKVDVAIPTKSDPPRVVGSGGRGPLTRAWGALKTGLRRFWRSAVGHPH